MYRKRRERKQKIIQKILWWYPVVLICIMFLLGACSNSQISEITEAMTSVEASTIAQEKAISSEAEDKFNSDSTVASINVSPDGIYTSKQEVALYLHEYGRLPSNYITKKQAQAGGWNSSDGNLQEVFPGKSIGGGIFGNYESSLPELSGRKYYECDIDYKDGYRNAKRIVWSNDGMIFYTDDHYKTFEQLY